MDDMVSRSQPCADASALAPTSAPRWMTLDRGGLIEWLRERAAALMIRSEDGKLARFLRDSAWGASDAFYELAGLIEDGQWDAVRPVDAPTQQGSDT